MKLFRKLQEAGAAVAAIGSLALFLAPASALAQFTFTNLHSFSVFPDGATAEGGLVAGSDGSFYGTCSAGGTNGGLGTVFNVTTNGVLTVLHEFTSSDGANPEGLLAEGTNGLFYGTTYSGGSNGLGTIFTVASNGLFTSLYQFSAADNSLLGANPAAGLLEASNGVFYGTTYNGGSNGFGTIFTITADGTLTSLYSLLGGTNSAYPSGQIVLASDGNIYGTTYSGGANGDGTVYQITTNGAFTVVFSFNGNDGSNPTGGLAQNTSGVLFGTAQSGGAYTNGTVFDLVPGGSPQLLHSFIAVAEGTAPAGALVEGLGGYMYGTLSGGGSNGFGTVFSLGGGGQISNLYSFTGSFDGGYPVCALALDNASNLYGVTTVGGTGFSPAGAGTVFSIVATNDHFSVVTAFPGTNDGQGLSALLFDTNGVFYGVSQRGGTNDVGNVFSITTNGVVSNLYSFTGGHDGDDPVSALVWGTNALLYGTSEYGGTLGAGNVFSVTTNGVVSNLYSFTGAADGADPVAALALGNDGNFYGCTTASGTTNRPASTNLGTLFKITPSGTFTNFYTFPGGVGGSYANGLVLASNGLFYGTTPNGGSSLNGSIFRVSPGGTPTTLYSFTGNNDGGDPLTPLVVGIDGNLYGTTSLGGSNGGNGTIFEYSLQSGFSTLYSFYGQASTNADGDSPSALLADPNGNFYATTSDGGAHGDGNVFELTSGGVFTNLYSFAGGSDGSEPETALTLGADGSLYGATSGGASGGFGSVFRLSGQPLSLFISNNPVNRTIGAGTNVTFTVSAGGPSLSYLWYFDTNSLTDTGNVSGSTTSALTLTGAATNEAGSYFVVVSNEFGAITSSIATLTVDVLPTIVTNPVSRSILNGSNAAFSVTAGGSTPLGYRWYFDSNALSDGGNISGSATSALSLTSITASNMGSYTVVVTNIAGAVTSTVATLTVLYPPSILTNPVSQSFVAGSTVDFSVTAGGTTPLDYQWYFNSNALTNLGNISGVNTNILVLSNVAGANAGSYYVVVSNLYGMATSSIAALAVFLPPGIVTNPLSQSVLVHSNVTFAATASGTGPLAYRWFFNSNGVFNTGTISGATTNTLTLSNILAGDAGSYYLTVTNAYGATTSAVATLTVLLPPTITTNPLNQLVASGSSANFAVGAGGTAPLSFQWQFDGSNIAGASLSTLSASAAGTYAVVVTNLYGSVTSAPAELSIGTDLSGGKPTVTITSPSANGRTANGVTGTATGQDGIFSVFYTVTNLNQGTNAMSGQAVLTNGSDNRSVTWSVNNILPGTNIISLHAEDTTGKTSAIVTRHFFLEQGAALDLGFTGPGSGSVAVKSFVAGEDPTTNNLNIGESYEITALPAAGSLFGLWTQTTPTNATSTNKASLVFEMESGVSLTVDFETNIFLVAAGAYNGLFMISNSFAAVTEDTAGLLGNLILRTNGAYSGKLTLQGATYSLTGGFNAFGSATNKVGPHRNPISLDMTLQAGANPPVITGSVSGTNGTTPWTASLLADRAANTLASGEFTLLIPPDTNSLPPTNSPGGDGYALITNHQGTVKSPGSAKITGALADGTAFNQTVPVSADGFVPLYASLNNKGLLLGWINLSLTNTNAVSVTGVAWLHPTRSSGLYKSGFTNIVLTNDILFSAWSNSPAFIDGLTNLLVLDTIGSTNALTNFDLSLSGSYKIGPAPLGGSINPKTGFLQVNFELGSEKFTGYGAVLLNGTNGGGYYVTKTNTAQAIELGR